MKFSNASKVWLSITSLIFTLTLLEMCCRFVNPQSPLAQTNDLLNRGRFTSPGIHHNHQPEFATELQVNSYGFVDNEWDQIPPNEFLLIGDSFVQGAQVPMDQSVGRRLDQYLPTGVSSMGVPGAGTTTELLLLEYWLNILQPKTVLLGLLPSNDILNNHSELESKSDKPFVNLTMWRETRTISIEMNEPSSSEYKILSHSHLFRWYLRQTQTTNIRQHKIQVGNGTPIDWHVYSPTPDETWNEAWLITTALFETINDLCKAKGVDFKVVLFPSIEEISPQHQMHIQKRYPSTTNWLFTETLEQKSLNMLQVAGIESSNILSLYPYFKAHREPDSLYFAQDHHWTESGHQLASQTIFEWLIFP